MCDGSGGTSWVQDKMGRVKQERRSIGAQGINHYIDYTFNLDGSLGVLQTPPMKTLNYTYSRAGRSTQLVDSTDSINFALNATYAPPGELTGVTLGSGTGFNGFTVANAYNNRLQPTLLSAVNSTTGSTVFSDSFDFHLGAGDNGNVFKIVNNRDTTHGRDQSFTYDSLNRILSGQSSGTGGTSWGDTYVIDPWGNLTNMNPISGKGYGQNFQAAPASVQNQLNGYCNDSAGNLVLNTSCPQPPGTAFTPTYYYDAENRLIWTSGYRYIYDADGQRVEKCQVASATTACPTSGTTGTLYWRGTGSDTLAETDLGGIQLEEYIFFNGQRIARRDISSNGGTAGLHYYFSDHLGTHGVVETVNTNGTTSCDQDIDYYPYGVAENDYCNSTSVPQNYKFTGKERDTESGLDNFGARYDASSLGRFMTPDSLNTLDLSHPQKLNRYTYANNNPLSNVDVGGQCTAPAVSGKQVGVCVESYIRSRFLPGIKNHLALAQGDNRGPNPHGGTFRTQTLLSVDPSTHEVKIQGQAAGKSCAIEGCYLGVNNSYLSKATHDDKGNTYFTLTVYGENGYEANGKTGAPGGWIEMQFSFTVNSKGQVMVSNPETKGYPSVSVYSYDSGGNAQDVWQQTEGNINDLVGPRKPANNQQSSQTKQEEDRLCALGNPAACD
jgi:RHS repeat-associated protein